MVLRRGDLQDADDWGFDLIICHVGTVSSRFVSRVLYVLWEDKRGLNRGSCLRKSSRNNEAAMAQCVALAGTGYLSVTPIAA